MYVSVKQSVYRGSQFRELNLVPTRKVDTYADASCLSICNMFTLWRQWPLHHSQNVETAPSNPASHVGKLKSDAITVPPAGVVFAGVSAVSIIQLQ